jgi:hypothetical protein
MGRTFLASIVPGSTIPFSTTHNLPLSLYFATELSTRLEAAVWVGEQL